MEASGKKLQGDISAQDATYCQPCSQDGETLPADAYCTICKELLCSTCVIFHKKQKMLKSHTLLDRSCMPTTLRANSDVQMYTELCDIHPEELIKYVCPSHQTLNCGHCLVTDHRACHVDIIADISKSFKNGQEYKDINKVIAKLIEDIDNCAGDVESKMQFIKELAKDEVSNLRNYRAQVNKYFDDREISLLMTIEQMKTVDITLLNSLKQKCENMKERVKEMKTKLKAQERNTTQLFIEVHRAQKQQESMQSSLADINREITIHHYQFKKDMATEWLLASCTGLGAVKVNATEDTTLHSRTHAEAVPEEQGSRPDVTVIDSKSNDQPTPEKLFQESDLMDHGLVARAEISIDPINLEFIQSTCVSVKSPSDNNDCWLTNMLLLSEDTILLTDHINKTIKLLDLHTNNLVSVFGLQGKPWSMCLLPLDSVAISVHHKGIQFVETQGKLSLGNIIKVRGDCRGIGYHNDMLIISYYTGKVEIIDMKGNVIKKITKDKNGQPVFGKPFYLTIVNDGQTADIYVSDTDKNIITKLDMDLNILRTYQDPALRGPRGITAVGNQLLICGQKSNNIMCLDLLSDQMSQPLGKKDSIMRPCSVCYNQQTNWLYVTGNVQNYAKLNNSVKSYMACHFKPVDKIED